MLAIAPIESPASARCAPTPSPVPRVRTGTHTGWWVLAAALVLVMRKPDSFINPQFWAEDFSPFFVDAGTVGSKALWWPYNGYLHLLPRLIAWLTAPLNPAIQPAAYVAASLGVTLWVVAQALSPRLELPGKPWLALAIVTVPHTGEIFLNPTNVQWVTALALIITLLKRDPETTNDWIEDGVLLGIVGLTGPFSVLLAPLFVTRALLRRTRASWLIAGAVAITAGIQGWFIYHAPALPDLGAWHWVDLVGVLAVRLPMTMALGEQWPVKMGYAWTAPLGAALVAGMVFLSCWRGRWRIVRLYLFAALVLVLVAAVKRVRPDTWAFYDTFNGDRYFYVPKVLAMWLVVLVIADLRNRWCRSVGVTLAALAFVANLPAFRFQAMPDLHWANYSEKILAGERIEVPINPGWKVTYPGRPTK
jgi:hypothetical protein